MRCPKCQHNLPEPTPVYCPYCQQPLRGPIENELPPAKPRSDAARIVLLTFFALILAGSLLLIVFLLLPKLREDKNSDSDRQEKTSSDKTLTSGTEDIPADSALPEQSDLPETAPPETDPPETEPPAPKEDPALSMDDITFFQKGESYAMQVLNLAEGETVVWFCANETVAKVDAFGLITAVGPGTTTVTAMVGDRSSRCWVHCDFEDEQAAARERYGAYYELCGRLRQEYGPAGVSDSWWPMVYGLSVAELVDFDGDGREELLVCYAPQGTDEPSYCVCEIWTWENGTLYCLLSTHDMDGGFSMNAHMCYCASIAETDRIYLLTSRDDATASGDFCIYDRIYWLEGGEIHSLTRNSVSQSGTPMSYEFTDYVYGEQGSMTDEEAIAHVEAVFNAPRTSFVVRDGAFFAPNIRAYYTEQDLVDRTEANLRTLAALAGR